MDFGTYAKLKGLMPRLTQPGIHPRFHGQGRYTLGYTDTLGYTAGVRSALEDLHCSIELFTR